ncbi:hypothetical protein MJO28_006998 [Puccinia striiformis f. sp. tritici]|uniref:Uncharacterized protein n=1 Tax=Puccinia striiformis f. sp. tritici TaxID=168172 RepID=A0ACC0EEX0_9BASI|nr:hypothetical protein MJO28_006998 [Puccinia striiformis f. sp. tritici]KAI7955556.1 hypothetical protein MJO29_006955 [Puccinia striiformis f. sp. tritici]
MSQISLASKFSHTATGNQIITATEQSPNTNGLQATSSPSLHNPTSSLFPYFSKFTIIGNLRMTTTTTTTSSSDLSSEAVSSKTTNNNNDRFINRTQTTTTDEEEDEEEEGYPSSLTASSIPRTSLVVEDYDERYGFSSSEESSGLADEQTRILKRRKKLNNDIISNNNNLSLDRSAYSDHSTSRPPSPLPSNHLDPNLPPLYSSSRHHHHLYHLKHHHHHHHHHHHQPNQSGPTTLITPALNINGITSNNSSTSCLESVSTGFAGIPSSSTAQHHHLQLSDDQVSVLPDSEFFHSHHLRTSAPLSNLRHYRPPHHTVPNLNQAIENSPIPSDQLLGAHESTHRSKRSWFPSRRSKRKDSIHALSATSSSSTTSLHSPPSSLDQFAAKHLDGTGTKYSVSTRRPSTTRWRRWMRSLNSSGLSLRWLKKLYGPRLPLGILLGLLLFISFVVSLTIFLIHYLDTDKEPLPWRTYCQEQREFPHELADSLDPVNVFVGVFSVDSAYERRHLIRSTYARHSRPIDPNTGQISHNVQLKFILGRPRLQHVRRVALEMETYNDIVVLDIQENMNRGKTYAFLNWASENATIPVYFHPLHEPKPKTGVNGIGGVMARSGMETVNVGVGFKKADFVVKADDDSFIVLSELERHLRVAPRTMTYWGYLIRNLFMGGECYALSADLVRYVASSEKVLDHVTGAEDKKVAKWMRIHPNASQINWVTERCWIYDHPKAGTTYAHGFLFPDEVKRVRAEGRLGLTDSEIEARGPGGAQSYSSVIKWKERYVAPKNLMTMEEEVEALVEGGGRFNNTDWKRPTENLVRLDEVLFESNDDRLLKSSIFNGGDPHQASIKSTPPRTGEFTPPVRDHYEEPSLKFGRPPNELMAKMPPMEDLPESPLKEKIREGMTAEINNLRSRQSSSEATMDPQRRTSSDTSSKSSAPKGSHINEPKPIQNKFIPSPTLRFEPEEMRIRDQRFLGRTHGGTVVVHYLKRSEWFLETSLILLGRAKTWDDGIIPLVYDPTQQLRANRDADPSSSSSPSIHPQGNSVLVSDKATSNTGLSTFNHHQQSPASSPSSTKNPQAQEHQKKIEVGKLNGWGKFDQVEEIQAGGLFGGARLAGSPMIDQDGTIREGRKPKLNRNPSSTSATSSLAKESSQSLASVHKHQVHSSDSNNDFHLRDPSTSDPNEFSLGNKDLDQLDDVPQEQQQEEEDEDGEDSKTQKNQIRKTQFGGAGWIRGKPRLRIADHDHDLQSQLPAEHEHEKEQDIILKPSSSSPEDGDEEVVENTAATDHSPSDPSMNAQEDLNEEEYLLQGLDSSLVLDHPPRPSSPDTLLSSSLRNPSIVDRGDHHHLVKDSSILGPVDHRDKMAVQDQILLPPPAVSTS